MSTICASSGLTCNASSDPLTGEHLGGDHATVGLDRQMKVGPRSARLRAIFCFQSLPCTEDLQAGSVDQYMQRYRLVPPLIP